MSTEHTDAVQLIDLGDGCQNRLWFELSPAVEAVKAVVIIEVFNLLDVQSVSLIPGKNSFANGHKMFVGFL